MEFKVQDEDSGENTLKKTAEAALKQIEEKQYAEDLQKNGIKTIYTYGFAFTGKRVLILKDT